MKKLLLILTLVIAGITCQAQEEIIPDWPHTDSIELDTVKAHWVNISEIKMDTLIMWDNIVIKEPYEVLISLGLLIDYKTYCYNDSIVVGFEFITGYFTNGWSSYALFNPEYKNLLSRPDAVRFLPYEYFFDKETTWDWIKDEDKKNYMENEFPYTHKPYINLKYLKCNEIKIQSKPTFEGFIQWLSDEYNKVKKPKK